MKRIRTPRWKNGGRARLAAAVVACAAGLVSAAEKRPNILFLFTDDQRADTIAALGNPAIKTPALDSLVRDGMAFRNCYILGSNMPAVCTPSRNMLMSGRAYFRWSGPYASADEPNFPVTMKQAGYFTYHHGKKGNTAVLIQEKFDINKHVRDDDDRESGEPGRTIVNDAIAFLESRKTDQPFFMYLAFGNPHDPRVAAKKYRDLYDPAVLPLPKNFMPVHPFDNGEMTVRDELLAPWPRTQAEIRRQLHDYYAVISGLDHHVGRLLAVLDKFGLRDNTIIIYASDNGLALGSHGLMGKQSLYDHSAKVPLIVSGAGIPRGARTDALVYLMDLFPTVCELTGIPVPSGLDGRSFGDVCRTRSKGPRRDLFFAYRDVQRAVRDGAWKLIRYPQINRTQLFDLQTDPDELHDLAGSPAQAARVETMMRRMREWQRELGDTAPLTSEHPKDPAFTPPTGEALQRLLGKTKAK